MNRREFLSAAAAAPLVLRAELAGAAADPFALVTKTNSVLRLSFDVLPGLTFTEEDAGAQTTAFGVLADLISVVRHFG